MVGQRWTSAHSRCSRENIRVMVGSARCAASSVGGAHASSVMDIVNVYFGSASLLGSTLCCYSLVQDEPKRFPRFWVYREGYIDPEPIQIRQMMSRVGEIERFNDYWVMWPNLLTRFWCRIHVIEISIYPMLTLKSWKGRG